jgi:hypothetical protein
MECTNSTSGLILYSDKIFTRIICGISKSSRRAAIDESVWDFRESRRITGAGRRI